MSIAVFASGSGSNFQALVEASRAEDWPEPIRLLVCDRPGARVLERAEKLGVPSLLVDPKEFSSKADYEAEILARLRREGIRRLVLAGYMRLIGPTLLDAYRWRIVNIHPSLLPAFPGKDAVGQALDYGVKWTGVTVHFVDEGMDTGPIIAQEPVRVDEGDDRASLTRKIQAVEHRLYPAVILDWISGRIKEPAGR
ncbi:MAG: phosphoribosylglycinamide formyltransferase [Planifilum fulgidum]|jgi:phosphoribosylglycinamide formyltransferase-1|nr:phosphoribosylglycinamide formyltransferase [Bacillota bacterium]MBO2531584.1 phosphoribosylglycinamide formyltransferase [Thermoactinomycetaceae bacterium]